MKETIIAFLPQLGTCVFICLCKMVEVIFNSMKTVLMVKGERQKAALCGFVECVIWGLVIASIISTLAGNYLLLFFYSLGYAIGLYLGSFLESKIALGTTHIEFIANDENTQKITEYLKEKDKGYTVFEGQGSKEKVNMIIVVIPRKESRKLRREIRELCNHEIFETSSEVNRSHGGYGTKR